MIRKRTSVKSNVVIRRQPSPFPVIAIASTAPITTSLSTIDLSSVTDDNISQLSSTLSDSFNPDPQQLSSSTTRTVTPVTTPVPIIEWILKNQRPYPFTIEISAELGVEIKKIKVFEIEGIVTASYLRANAFSHSISIQLSSADINEIKAIVRTAPGHNETGYRWPFENGIGKFTSKDSKDTSTRDFEPILDGRGINLKDFTGELSDLGIDDVVEGIKVCLEYTPIPYPGKKAKGLDEGFPGGCSLKLHSITIIGISEQSVVLDITSPSKRRRLH